MAVLAKYYELIKTPIITEQTMDLVEKQNKYTFKVSKDANKVEIKKAIEAIFNVKVISVNTINVAPKPKKMGRYEGFKSGYKKAIVGLAQGQKIDVFGS